MKLSIVIPHYNSLNTLKRLLASINKSEINLEVFVVDDNSFEEPCIENQYFDYPIRLLTNKNNKGAGGARNTALDEIESGYVLFADSDDEFLSGWGNLISEYLNSDNDIVFFSPEGIKEDGSETKRHESYKQMLTDYCNDNNKLDVLYKFHVPWSKLFRVEFLKQNKIRFDEVIASNDVMFSLKSAVYCKKFSVDKRSIYRVYESVDSMIKQTKFNSLKSRYDVLNRYNSFLLMNVQNANQYCISPLPIIFKIIKNRPFHGMKILMTAFIKAPIIFAFRGTLNSIIRRFQSKK